MRGSRLGVAKAWSRRKPLAGAPPLGSEYQVYSVASPRKWRHTSIQPSAERRAKCSAQTKVDPASSTSGSPVLKSPRKRSGSAIRASAAARRASQNRVLAAPSGSLAPGLAVRMWITVKPKPCSGRSTSSQRTAFSGGAAEGSSREDANAVIDAGGAAGSDMRPAVGGESLAERHAGPGAEFGEGDDIGIVIGDGSDNADIARPAAVLNVPGEKFHAP